jgi:hypothetical protein
VAIKDWEMPLKAHLRGAIALINEKRTKIMDSQSSTIYDAVESQIVSLPAILETIYRTLIKQAIDQDHSRSG